MDENLKAMCQGCHLHYDREDHAQTRAATKAAATINSGAGSDFLMSMLVAGFGEGQSYGPF